VLQSAAVRDFGTRIDGQVRFTPDAACTVLLFTTDSCEGSGELVPFGSVDVVTDAAGFASFSLLREIQLDDTLSAVGRVTDATGDSSPLSECIPIRIELTYWTDVALSLSAAPTNAVVNELLTLTLALSNRSQTPTGPPAIGGLTVECVLPSTLTFVEAGGGGVEAGGVVRFTNVTVAPGGGPELAITVVPTEGGAVVVEAKVDHAGPYLRNNSAALGVPIAVTPPVVADLAITLTAAPEPVRLGAELTYTITVTNRGTGTAPTVRVADVLPASLTYLRATATHGTPTVTEAGLVCDLGSLTNGEVAVVTATVQPTVAGPVTNTATVELGTLLLGRRLMLANGGGAAVIDPDLTNNVATAVSTVLVALPVEVVAAPRFNPQTGLFEQVVKFTNTGTNALGGVRLTLTNLTSGVSVLNASGTAGGQPYLQLHRQVEPGATVGFTVEFHQRDRAGFPSPTYVATEVAETAAEAAGTEVPTTPGRAPLVLSGSLNAGRFLLEFRSEPGRRYAVQYRDSLSQTWSTAVPLVTAPANVVQWFDDGPPKTTAPPPAASRLYRVLLLAP
jgi:uncharacterized repeat protein (TIGR01451 family)